MSEPIIVPQVVSIPLNVTLNVVPPEGWSASEAAEYMTQAFISYISNPEYNLLKDYGARLESVTEYLNTAHAERYWVAEENGMPDGGYAGPWITGVTVAADDDTVTLTPVPQITERPETDDDRDQEFFEISPQDPVIVTAGTRVGVDIASNPLLDRCVDIIAQLNSDQLFTSRPINEEYLRGQLELARDLTGYEDDGAEEMAVIRRLATDCARKLEPEGSLHKEQPAYCPIDGNVAVFTPDVDHFVCSRCNEMLTSAEIVPFATEESRERYFAKYYPHGYDSPLLPIPFGGRAE